MTIEHVQVSTTVRNKEDAQTLARGAVEARLGACAQVHGPVTSTYWWDGEVQHDDEWTCVIKTSSEAASRLVEFLSDKHPYDNPEVVVLPIVGGSEDYLDWITEEVTSPAE
jgi:periplasmic divalent cation tolerance protein